MRPIGFSTGALALGDLRVALDMMRGFALDAVELSALRLHELPRLVDFSFDALLGRFKYISVHAPAQFDRAQEPYVVAQLVRFAQRGWPVVLHPDAIHEPRNWRCLGSSLLIENMDKRKRIGRTAAELFGIFALLPNAQLCFDIAHARQFDSSLTEAYRILRQFGDRLRQVHLSEVSSASKHDRVSISAALSYRQLASMIPLNVPIIMETPVTIAEMRPEIERAQFALGFAFGSEVQGGFGIKRRADG